MASESLRRHALTLPDLGIEPVTASLWLVEVGSQVSPGDRILEVLAGCAAVDLPAPVEGVLVETLVEEDDALVTGQVLGIIESAE